MLWVVIQVSGRSKHSRADYHAVIKNNMDKKNKNNKRNAAVTKLFCWITSVKGGQLLVKRRNGTLTLLLQCIFDVIVYFPLE